MLIVLVLFLHVAGYARPRIASARSQERFALRLLTADPAGGGDGAISPDGRYFVISSKRSGHWNLWIYDIQAATWSRLTSTPADDIEAQWSPDGSRLAFTSTRSGNKDLWVLSLADRSVRQITATPEEEEYPAWSPDGKWLVYTTGPWKRRDFHLIAADGGFPLKVTRQSGLAGACSFMPDGQALVCHTYDSGAGDIIQLPLTGDAALAVTSGPAWDYKPTVSPDGKWLAFSRSYEGPSAIWLQPLAGGQPRPLVTTSHSDRWPSWTATGDRLFFHRLVEQGTAVKMLDTRTGAVRTLVGAHERPLQASFDPRAQRVVYCAALHGRHVIRLLHVAHGTVQTLDTGPGEACFPRWSPDGHSIAFVAKVDQRWEINTIRVDGSKYTSWTKALPDLKGLYGPLDWSPDSTRIAFRADTQPFESDLYVLDTRRGEIRNVTNDTWFDEAPAWTPDGRGLLFMSTRGGDWTWGLFRLALADGAVEVVASPDYTAKNFPRMSRNGSIIWSMENDRGVEYLAAKSRHGKIKTLTRAGAGARWPSYSADGRFILFTTVERRVEYWLAENMFAPGSPLLQHMPAHAAEPPSPRPATENAPVSMGNVRLSSVQLSPIDVHKR
jgi:TolB protein